MREFKNNKYKSKYKSNSKLSIAEGIEEYRKYLKWKEENKEEKE